MDIQYGQNKRSTALAYFAGWRLDDREYGGTEFREMCPILRYEWIRCHFQRLEYREMHLRPGNDLPVDTLLTLHTEVAASA